MSKEHIRRCHDCEGEDLYALFGGKGNGKCSHCRGQGIIYGIEDAIPSILVGSDNFHTCEICSGTCRCQTCGGTGYVHYNENNSEKESGRASDSSGTSNQSSSGSYGDISSGSDSGNQLLGAFAFILIIAIVFALFEHKPTSNSSYTPIQSSQPVDTVWQGIVDPNNRAIQQTDTNNENNNFTYPNADKIKSDLIGRTMPSWHFDSLSQFQDFKITNIDTTNERLFLTIDLTLRDGSANKIYSSKILVSYFKGTSEWFFSTIDQQSYSEMSPVYSPPVTNQVDSNNDSNDDRVEKETTIPYVTQHYDYIDAPAYVPTGVVLFWTSCVDCHFEVIISGHKSMVGYSGERPSLNPTNPNFTPFNFSSGLYYFSIYDNAGHRYRYQVLVKGNQCLFIRVDKARE